MFTDDQDIQRALNAALKVEPSGDFDARVRRRIEKEGSGRDVLPVWLATAAAAVLLIAGGWFAVWGSRTVEPQPPAVLSGGPATAPQPLASEAGAAAEPPKPTADARLPRRERRSVRVPVNGAPSGQEPEVLVPAGQLALIQRFLRQANSGRVEVPDTEAQSAQPAELVVAPMVIEPIVVAGAPPAGSTSQGPKGLQ
jgi:hypothetical protein